MAKKSFQINTSIGNAGAKLVLGNLPFVLFLGFLAVIYIANAHYAEGQVRDIQKMKREVTELNREYKSIKADLMLKSRHSAIERKVKKMGLKATRKTPKRIIVE